MTVDFMLAISIDVECDKDERWLVRQPLSFVGVEHGVGSVLAPLFKEYGARPTYLLSPEVMRHEQSVALFSELGDCELGTHLHPEFISHDGLVGDTAAVPCQQPPAKERGDLEALTDLFRDVFGRDPLSYRAGRFGVGTHTIRTLGDLGYGVDTSVTPHKAWDYGLDFRGAPDHPYCPCDDDITREGPRGGILEVPVTLRPSPAPAALSAAAQQMQRTHLPSTRRFAKWARGPVWLRPGWSSPAALLRFVRDAADADNGTVLNMMFHNVDVVEGLSMNAASEAAVARTLDGLKAVLEATAAAGGRFGTLSQVRQHIVDAPTAV